MASYNRIILMGNLTRDPEHRQLASGQAVCRLSLATNRQFKNKQSDALVQEVCYIDIDVWGAQAESCRQYLQKGRPILVEGRLKYDTWQDQSGQTRSKHSIVADNVKFLGSQGGASAELDEAGKETAEPEANNFQLNANNPVERDLMQQLEKAKAKIQGVKSPASSYAPTTPVGSEGHSKASSFAEATADKTADRSPASVPTAPSAEFIDQPPFSDDLPF